MGHDHQQVPSVFQAVLPPGGQSDGMFDYKPTPEVFVDASGNSNDDGSNHVKEVRGVAPFMVKSTQMVDGMVLRGMGETLRLECYVDGLPSPTIVWYKVGKIGFAVKIWPS